MRGTVKEFLDPRNRPQGGLHLLRFGGKSSRAMMCEDYRRTGSKRPPEQGTLQGLSVNEFSEYSIFYVRTTMNSYCFTVILRRPRTHHTGMAVLRRR
uniref:Uncharacterized protein n=1 Tax=Candidatus Kentrum sp. LFY TaxID=2126342 RepID=A0A450WTS0_9GAMM|nr:MAG: hypothetical protein BECKLFY1418C_GA0070996_10732 [Candidatus Kentron sp. LFY]